MAKHAHENEPSIAAIRKAVHDVEELESEKLSIRMSAASRCAKLNGKIKDVKDNAVEAGIPKQILNVVLARRKLHRKLENALELEKDQRAEVLMLEKKCGWDDTPLARAASKTNGGSGTRKAGANPVRGVADAKPDPKHDQQPALAASVGEKALDDLTKH